MRTDEKLPSEELMNAVAKAYGYKYDDRNRNPEGHPALMDLADEFGISMVKVRKILITKGLFSTKATREAARLREQGKSIEEMCRMMGRGAAAVKASLPYEKGLYNADPKTAAGKRVERGRNRKKGVKELRKLLDCYGRGFVSAEGKLVPECRDALWKCIVLFENYPFRTTGRSGQDGLDFKYRLKISKRSGQATDELVISRKEHSKTITRSTVELAFITARRVQAEEGCVKNTRKIPCFGRSYLYAIFLKWGIITDAPKNEEA